MHGETLSQHCPLLGKLYHAPAWFTPGPRIEGQILLQEQGRPLGDHPLDWPSDLGSCQSFQGCTHGESSGTIYYWSQVSAFMKKPRTWCWSWDVGSYLCPSALQTELVDEVSCTGLYLLLFSCSVVSDSLWSHGLQRTRPPCPLPSPGLHKRLLWSCN